MLFNSGSFLVFFPLVTLLYFWLPHAYRWALLLAASCVFYMWFVPAYILVLAITIGIDYWAGRWIEESRTQAAKRIWLWGSVISTCLVLFVFKYFNFFAVNMNALSAAIGWNYSISVLEIILPVGLSFHTFQSLSYVIEVYRGAQRAERHFGIYALYVMYYPQLVAGPIERPQNLLHQFRERHDLDYGRVASGLKLMAWGLFKKVVIADRLAMFVNPVYDQPADFSGPVLVLATVFFAFQIYCDFSGYSDIAIGASEVMGIRLMKNFNHPYASQSIAEFWRRWHISLSTWFRDYVYLPLGGNRLSRRRWYANLMITFLVSGLWHGASWNFVIWGGLNGVFLVVSQMTKRWREAGARRLGLTAVPRWLGAWRQAVTFALICLTWVFFRAPTFEAAKTVLRGFFQGWEEWPPLFAQNAAFLAFCGLLLVVLNTVLGAQERGSIRLRLLRQPAYVRWGVYLSLVAVCLLFRVRQATPFIYFQF
ncbi:MAG: MBOAT family protein [Bacteriovoracia bacterium]